MQRLPSNSKGEAKKSVESIFCAKALKSLKRDFSNSVLVSHLKMKLIFDQHEVNTSGKIGFRNYHQQVMITNTWVLSIGFENLTLSSNSIFQKSLVTVMIMQIVPSIY